MCGIFGALGDATDEALTAAIAALQHRGPDANGRWRDGPFGLAHTRLKVIDLSELAAQPMAGCDRPSPDGGGGPVRVTFNGEIYNHHALRAELEARGHRFRSRGDTEVIVHGYEEWGASVVERLDGMFAFGVWDPSARRLLLARDRTGKKPLYYATTGGDRALRFASEVKALTAAGHEAALDPAALPMFLSWGFVPAPATLHRSIEQLPPASRLTWRPGEPPRVEAYWRPTFTDPPLDVSDAEAIARVRALVIAAVERRLESDVPLGAFLSGGIDSTIVVGVMARLLGRRVRTFSIGFGREPAFDEAPAARATAAAFGTEHTEFDLGEKPEEAAALVEHLVHLHDGPFADSSALPTYTVSRLTKQHVTVALSGDGGDELFCGYLRLVAAEASERVPAALRTAASRLARLAPARALPPHSLLARARRFLDGAHLPIGARMARWNSVFAFDLDALLRPELARTLDLAAPLAWQERFFDAPGTPLARILDHNFRTYLAWDLQPKVDRTSAGCGLEVRSPLLDTALVEYAGRLPDRLRRRGRTTKWALRQAFADLLPDEIKRRPKRGFGVPLAAWMRGPLLPWLRDLLGRGARLDALLQRTKIDALLDAHAEGRADHAAQLFTLATLEIWLRALASHSARAAAA